MEVEFGTNEVLPDSPKPEEVAVNNAETIEQSLYRRRLILGAGQGFGGEVNTNASNRDYAQQFGYPPHIDKYMYQRMYDRNPIAHRVVQLYPLECWQQTPTIYDSDAPAESEFEKKVNALFSRHNVWGMLRRADILSGIGNFGIILMGVGDGKKLNEPVEIGKDANGKLHTYPLQYVRAFPHSQVEIASVETDKTNPRYGHPTMYRVQFQPFDIDVEGGFIDFTMQEIHWTRVVHVADNREISEIYGVPRMQLVYNNLLDIEKILGASGEMFYKGAYPGFVVEASDNTLGTVQLDSESIRKEIEMYENNFQRWMALKNAHVNALGSQYSDPASHIEVCVNQIAIGMGCPSRILLGSERGELASSQDAVIWKKRLMERQKSYLTPFLIKPVIMRLIMYGMLPVPYDQDFHVSWPNLSEDTPVEIYATREKQIQFIQNYIDSGLNEFMTPIDYLVKFCDMSEQEAKGMLERAEQYNREQVDKEAVGLLVKPGESAEGGGGMPGGGGGGMMF